MTTSPDERRTARPPLSRSHYSLDDNLLGARGEEEGAELQGAGFQRRNARRGLSFKPRGDKAHSTTSARGTYVCIVYG